MADVRAKFYVASVKITGKDGPSEYGEVALSAVTRGDINKNWSKWTPSGNITLGILNPSAFAIFRDLVGKEFYVDFTLAPDEEQSSQS